MNNSPRVSVIIPIAPNGNCDLSVDSVRRQNYDKKNLEILVAIGRHRSIQRNKALEKAGGDIIWFMDNDVIINDPDYLQKHVEYYRDPKIASVGGPSLTPTSDSFLQRAVGYVMGSFFATQAARSRYARVGKSRVSSEKELILCSQTFRAAPIKNGGFDARLHSGNEENELMNRLAGSGHNLIYDPDLFIFRSQRSSIKQFIMQIGKYGKSRLEHFLVNPRSLEFAFMIPFFFFCYLVSLPVAYLLPLPGIYKLIYTIPLALYTTLLLYFSTQVAFRSKTPRMFLYSLLLFPLVHISYALGKVYAVYFRIFKREQDVPEVKVEKIKV